MAALIRAHPQQALPVVSCKDQCDAWAKLKADSYVIRKKVWNDAENSVSPNHLTFTDTTRSITVSDRKVDPFLGNVIQHFTVLTALQLLRPAFFFLDVKSLVVQIRLFSSSKTFPKLFLQPTINTLYHKTRHFFQALLCWFLDAFQTLSWRIVSS